MKNLRRLFVAMLVGISFLGYSTATLADERATKEEAVAMVKKAVAFYKANGKEKSFEAMSDQKGQFRDRELFMIVLDSKGNVLAHTAMKKMINQNIMELRDTNGVYIIKSFFKAVEKSDSGWSDEYFFMNPALQKMEFKRTYVEKFDNILFACGYHYEKK
ncbi:MAG: cache domain-containing protein [Burkholderiales bacterium]|nr:cache domain-containing protein [Burkholderiales bacterium]